MNRALLRLLLRVLVHVLYRMEILGAENRPKSGAVLFVSNHLSYSDPVLISACARRSIRFLMWRDLHDHPMFEWFFRAMGAIPIASNDSRRELMESLGEARRSLQRGEHIGLFAEGEISRVGHILPFRKGLQSIVKGLSLSIIPVHLDGLWGSAFSYERSGTVFRTRPRRVPYRVRVSFGAPMPASSTVFDVRQAVMDLGEKAFERRAEKSPALHRSFLKTAKKRWNATCVNDATSGQIAVSAYLLARRWRKNISGTRPVGICIAPSADFAIANIALCWAGKTVVYVNPNLSTEQRAAECARQNLAVIVDSLPETTALSRFFAAAILRWMPTWMTTYKHSAPVLSVDGMSNVRFSHNAVHANITALNEVFALNQSDTITATLDTSSPLLATAGLWWPLVAGTPVRYAKPVGEGQRVSIETKGTVRCEVRDDTAYARANLGGVVCTNTTDVRYGDNNLQLGHRDGTVGRPIPGVSVRIVDISNGEILPPNEPGQLQVRTAARPGMGWINTNDTAVIDEQGFVRLCNLSDEPGVSISERSI